MGDLQVNAMMLSRCDFETLLDIQGELVREDSHVKQRRLKRPHTAQHRKIVKTSKPPYGIAGRRNHNWNWNSYLDLHF